MIRDLVRSMSALPGSRAIVMVSPGFILSSEHRLNENDVFDKADLTSNVYRRHQYAAIFAGMLRNGRSWI